MKIVSDKSLSQKIERTEALATADFVESRRELFPDSGAEWVEIAGVYLCFDSPDSPCTQTFGLGMFDDVTNSEMESIEAFFKQRNAPVLHEVSPLADPSVLALLNERGYQPHEFSNVMYKVLDEAGENSRPGNPQISTRIIREDETELFAQTSTHGWADEMPEYADMLLEFSRIGAHSKGSLPFIAELKDAPIATGSLFINGDIANLAGASTIPEARKQGAQTALLAARLKHAVKNGCTIAIMGAMPGSQSQRNAEKNGFRIAYTRTKWKLK